tara:strand:- start:886 stop:2676 length:1791 start_codon:yes stop_codon:yes gene_type:complete
MRRALLPLLLITLALGAFWQSVDSRLDEPEHASPELAEDPATGAVLVDLADDADADEQRRIGALLEEAIAPYAWAPTDLGETLSEAAQLHRLEVPASEVADIRRALRSDDAVEAVEVERIWTLPESAGITMRHAHEPAEAPEASRGTFRPDDPYYKHQWHLDQIQMPAAWTRSRGEGAVVAVIDTGVLAADRGRFKQAPDLAGTRFVPGHDFVDDDDQPDDEHGHGTHVAGTIAQATNNGLGVAGVAPGAAIMPIRVLDARGAGRWGSVAAGIRWAADHGADVINLSLGGGMPSASIRNAIAHAHAKGVVVIAAAGNTGRGRVQYPAAHRYAVAVGAVRYDETLSFYSSYGTHLDVVAPGGDLRVDQNGDGLPDGVIQNTMLRGNPARHDYIGYQGTSMAAPHVAGVAALLRASGVQDPDAIERLLKSSAKAKSDTKRYGAGLVQADAALRAASQGSAAGRGAAALGLAFLVLLGLGRRRGAGWAGTLGVAGLTAGVLAVVPWHLLGLGFLGAPMASLGGLSSPWMLLAAGVVMPLLGAGLFAKRPAIGAGLAFGVAGTLLAEALLPMAVAAVWAGPVLVALALGAALVGRQVALR